MPQSIAGISAPASADGAADPRRAERNGIRQRLRSFVYTHACMDEVRTVRLITFSVGDEIFVFDIMRVRQIVPYTGSTPVPSAPAFIEGITVIRDEVIPIVDLRKRFFPKLESMEQPLLLVTKTPAGIIGLKVDGVRRILNVRTDEIMTAPKVIHGLRGELFIGFIKRDSEIYLLLDLDELLSSEERAALDAADLAAGVTGEIV